MIEDISRPGLPTKKLPVSGSREKTRASSLKVGRATVRLIEERSDMLSAISQRFDIDGSRSVRFSSKLSDLPLAKLLPPSPTRSTVTCMRVASTRAPTVVSRRSLRLKLKAPCAAGMVWVAA